MAVDKLLITSTKFKIKEDSEFQLVETIGLNGKVKKEDSPCCIQKMTSGSEYIRHGSAVFYNDKLINITCEPVRSDPSDYASPLQPMIKISCNPNKITNQQNYKDALPFEIDNVLAWLPSYLRDVGVIINKSDMNISRFDVGLCFETSEPIMQYIDLFNTINPSRTLQRRNYQDQTIAFFNRSRKLLFYNKYHEILFHELKDEKKKDKLKRRSEKEIKKSLRDKEKMLRLEIGFLKKYYADKYKVRSYLDFKKNWRFVAGESYEQITKVVELIKDNNKEILNADSIISEFLKSKENNSRWRSDFSNKLASHLLNELFKSNSFLDVMKEADCHTQQISDMKKVLDSCPFTGHDNLDSKIMKKEILDKIKEHQGRLIK